MRCRNGVTEKLLSVTDTTALHSPKHPRNCVRRASGFVLTRHTGETFRTFQSALLPLVAYSQDLVKRFSAPSASLHARSVARNLEAPLAGLASCLVDLSAACDPFDRRPGS